MFVRFRSAVLAALSCLVIALALLAAPITAQLAVPRSAAPAWIEWLAQPAPIEARLRAIEDGSYTLLDDTQVRFDGTYSHSFKRQMRLVTDRAGLEGAAQQQIIFDPESETLAIHRVAVWRDGQMIDRTRQADIDILRREASLDSGILNGQRTALVRISDVRVGDVVDLAWSWEQTGGVWRGVYSADFSLGWSVPVALTRVKLVMPAATPLMARSENGASQAREARQGEWLVREWRAEDPNPVFKPDRTPDWWNPWAQVSVSTMANWQAVVDWERPLYAGDVSLPADYAAKVDAIAAATADPAKRTIAALRLVQDSIRYTSLSIGAGGYVPRAPAVTIASGFGDCKDKTQLLIATLARLGIQAWPALTDMDAGTVLDRRLPDASAFDHVIVLARVNGRDHWLDPTRTHQGGMLDTLAPLPYGFALPVRPGQGRLERIANPVPARPTMQALDRYRRSDRGISLAALTLFTGDEADIKRAAIANGGVAKMERQYMEFYRALYPGIERLGSFRIIDDRDANRLLVAERYEIPASSPSYAKTLNAFEIQASTLREIYKDVGRASRTAPITMPYTIYRTHRIVIETPDHRPNRPSSFRSDGPGFTLTLASARDAGRLTLDYTLKGKGPLIDGKDAAKLADQVEKLNSDTYWSLDINSRDGGQTESAEVLPAAIILVALGWLAIGVLAIIKINREPLDADTPLISMPVWRYALLTIASFSVYAAYWAWRQWRWSKIAAGADVWPFWRGFFLPIWAGPTFFEANRHAREPLPEAIGWIIGFGMIGAAVILRIYDVVVPANSWTLFIDAGLGLLLVPALIATNRANDPARVAANARLGGLAIAGIGTGALTWALVIATIFGDL